VHGPRDGERKEESRVRECITHHITSDTTESGKAVCPNARPKYAVVDRVGVTDMRERETSLTGLCYATRTHVNKDLKETIIPEKQTNKQSSIPRQVVLSR